MRQNWDHHHQSADPFPAYPYTLLGATDKETSRPPFVDSRDIKRMLECPAEEMHKFSDPKNYRTRPRFTRLALPLREIEGAIQVISAPVPNSLHTAVFAFRFKGFPHNLCRKQSPALLPFRVKI